MKNYKKIAAFLTALSLVTVSASGVFADTEVLKQMTVEDAEVVLDTATECFEETDSIEAEVMNTEPTKIIYQKFVAGADNASDIIMGGISVLDAGYVAVPTDPTTNDFGLSWINTTKNSDSCYARKSINSIPVVGAVKYYATERPAGKQNTGGLLCFAAGDSITAADNKLNIKFTYYANFNSDQINVTLRYVKNNNKQYSTKGLTLSSNPQNPWQTATVSITDAYFNGTNVTGLADGKIDFRLEAGTNELFVKEMIVSNCTEEVYNAINENASLLSLDDIMNTEAVSAEAYILPTTIGDATVEWAIDNTTDFELNGNTLTAFETYTAETATLTAKIISDGVYITKAFALTTEAAPYVTKGLGLGAEQWTTANGMKKVSVPLSNADKASGKCVLLLIASDKTSGEIMDITTGEVSLGLARTTTVSAELADNQAYDYSCYIWNESNSSLKNCAPAISDVSLSAGNNFETIAVKDRKLSLNWKKAYDDYDKILQYEIYLNGNLVQTVSDISEMTGDTNNSYTFENITTGTEYEISVIAYDHEGKKSEIYKLSGKLEKMLTCDLAKPNNTSGGFEVRSDAGAGNDAEVKVETVDGVSCLKTVHQLDKSRYSFMYFKTNTSLLTGTNDVILELTYLDKGLEDIMITYISSTAGKSVEEKFVTKTNTGEWKTARYKLSGAVLGDSAGINGYDFRLRAKNAELYAKQFDIIKADLY